MKKIILFLGIVLMMSGVLIGQSYSGGSGSSGDPWLIADLDDLQELQNTSGDWGSYFKQIADIDASATSSWDSNSGFSPIGNFSTEFTGSYNGDGYTIHNLYISRSSTNYVALFGYTSGAEIQNLGLVDVNTTGQIYIGGLVGYNSYFSTVSECFVTGSVKGENMVGGLVGYNHNSTVSNSYSTASVTRSSGISTDFGSFCGYTSNSTIEYCYSTGKVYQSSGTIWSSKDKGFVGYNSSGTYTNNFYDSQASEQTSGTGATSKTTEQMKIQSTFTDWNFASIWEIFGGDGANYPTLRNCGYFEEPTTQASDITFTDIYSTQMSLNWSNGDGVNRVVFAKAANTGTAEPADRTTYTANPTFGSGTQIGTSGWYCVYEGSGTSETVSGLTATTDYIFQVFEYNGSSGNENYLTSTATDNPKSQATNSDAVPPGQYALSFDGSNDYVSNNYTSQIQTLEFWLKTNDLSTSHSLFGQRYNSTEVSGNWQMHWENGTGKLRIYGYQPGGTSMVTSTVFETARWYHVAISSSGSKVTYYVNGVFDSEHDFDVTLGGGSNTEPLTIGASGANGAYYFYNGTLDEIRIWSDVRTQTEIKENMCKHFVGNETGLVVYYKMSDGTGTVLTDNSSNNYNGTLNNMNNADWITSGAAIGDASTSDYDSPSSVNFASSYGDDLTVGTITGSPDGVQIYRVDSAPNVTTAPGNLTQLSRIHYFGVYIVGGTTPTYTLTYNYYGHPGISNESTLDLAYRANNATESWTEANATLDTNANTLTLTDQSGTEYILGSTEGNTLPVVLSAFTAQFIENTPTIHWSTQSETDNMGWFIYKNIENDFSSSDVISDLIEGHGTTTQQQYYTYEDNINDPEAGDSYYYWLESIDYSGIVHHYTQVAILNIPDTGHSGNSGIAEPEQFGLLQNEPNPVITSTRISFNLKETAQVELSVYNVKGQLVKNLYSGNSSKRTIMWDGKDDDGKDLENGVYLFRLMLNGRPECSKKLILMK